MHAWQDCCGVLYGCTINLTSLRYVEDQQRNTMDQYRSTSSSNLSSTADNIDHRDDHILGPNNPSMLDFLTACPDTHRPISFLHDEVVEFNRIFTELATSSRRTSSTTSTNGGLLSSAVSKCHDANDTRSNVPLDSPNLKIVDTCPISDDVFQTNATNVPDGLGPSSENLTNSDDVSISCVSRDNQTMGLIMKESGGCICGRDVCQTVGGIENAAFVDSDAESNAPGDGLEHSGKLTRRHSDSVLRSNLSMSWQFLRNQRRFNSFDLEKLNDLDACGKFELPSNFDELNEASNLTFYPIIVVPFRHYCIDNVSCMTYDFVYMTRSKTVQMQCNEIKQICHIWLYFQWGANEIK